MRKNSIVFIALIFLLAGCSHADVPKVDEYTWEMTSVQRKEQDGQAVAYGKRGSSTLENAVSMELMCTAKDGVLTLTDTTNGKTYSGTYKLKEIDPRSAHYDITLDGNEGLAVVAMTTYHDGSQDPTFIINLDEYVINFFAE